MLSNTVLCVINPLFLYMCLCSGIMEKEKGTEYVHVIGKFKGFLLILKESLVTFPAI